MNQKNYFKSINHFNLRATKKKNPCKPFKSAKSAYQYAKKITFLITSYS